MAFSAGTFSLYSPGNPVVTGTTIASTWANNTLNDIATGLSTCVLKDGSQTITANIPMGGFKFTGLAAGSAAGNSVRWEQIYDASSSVQIGPAAIASGKNITARTDASTPNTKLDITADEIILEDSSGNTHRSSTVSLVIDFGTVGANGIDAGAQASSTWYYGWTIYNPTTGTTAGLGSLSATAPTLPSGYTFKALATAARSDGSTHFIKYRQTGNQVFYEALNSVLAGGTASTETAVATSTFVPPNALAASIQVEGLVNAGAAGQGANNFVVRHTSGSTFLNLNVQAPASSTTYNDIGADVPNISQNVYYLNTTSGSGGTTGSMSINVLGFKLPMGGE